MIQSSKVQMPRVCLGGEGRGKLGRGELKFQFDRRIALINSCNDSNIIMMMRMVILIAIIIIVIVMKGV